jgi:hypothetical protein
MVTVGQIGPYAGRVLRWFEHAHLPEHLAAWSAEFAALAERMATDLDDSPELTSALNALVVAKDAAVRAAIVTHEASGAGTG